MTGKRNARQAASPAGALRARAPGTAAATPAAAARPAPLSTAEMIADLEPILEAHPELIRPLMDSLDELLRESGRGGRW